MNKTLRANLCLLLTAAIWGSAFVAQRMGMDAMGPICFTALRNFLGCFVVAIVGLLLSKLGIMARINGDQAMDRSGAPADAAVGAPTADQSPSVSGNSRRTFVIGGLSCGLVLCIASNFQQFGLVTVDAGKSGFLTALYIVLVPLLGLFLRKPLKLNHLIGVVLAVAGLYFLCINGSFTIVPGDLACLIGAFFWSLHILVIDHFAPKLNPIKLAAAQFFVCGCLSLILGLIMEDISLASIQGAALAIGYTGIMSSGVAFTLQIVAQRDAHPTAASIIMSMEALFAVIFGFLFLHEMLTSRELLGCIIMLIAVIIAQVSFKEIRGLFKGSRV